LRLEAKQHTPLRKEIFRSRTAKLGKNY